MNNLDEFETHRIYLTERSIHTIDVSDIMISLMSKFRLICITISISGTSARFSSGFISKDDINGVVIPIKKQFGGVASEGTFQNIAALSALKYYNRRLFIDTLNFPEQYDVGQIIISAKN